MRACIGIQRRAREHCSALQSLCASVGVKWDPKDISSNIPGDATAESHWAESMALSPGGILKSPGQCLGHTPRDCFISSGDFDSCPRCLACN